MKWICIGYGPSLCEEDIKLAVEARNTQQAKLITSNSALWLVPDVDAHVASDREWWFGIAKDGIYVSHPDKCYSAGKDVAETFGVNKLVITGREGFDTTPGCVKGGKLSGYQAIQIAYSLGATSVGLLGYDMMGGDYKPTRHGPPTTFEPKIKYYDKLKEQSPIPIVNCSRQTALTQFPRMTLEEYLRHGI